MTIETISPVLEAERHDVRAHLIGGVPVSEVEALVPLFRSVGLDLAAVFVPATEPSQLSLFDQRPEPLVDEAYYAFRQELTNRSDLARAVAGDVGVVAHREALDAQAAAKLDEVVAAIEHLWDKYQPSLRTLEIRRSELKARLDGLLRELGYV